MKRADSRRNARAALIWVVTGPRNSFSVAAVPRLRNSLDGTVIQGDGRGRTIGFPTANICTENELIPPHDVYATTATLGGIVRPSVTNIGVRPTVESSGQTTVETHVFGVSENLYGATIRVGFVRRLRDERKFATVDMLREQIADDCDRAQGLFERLSL